MTPPTKFYAQRLPLDTIGKIKEIAGRLGISEAKTIALVVDGYGPARLLNNPERREPVKQGETERPDIVKQKPILLNNQGSLLNRAARAPLLKPSAKGL